MTRLDDTARSEFLTAHPGWDLDGEEIRRTFAFDDFAGAMGFTVKVALSAEVADHHPDIDIRWNKVTLVLSTHSEKALTDKDTALAAQFDELAGRS
jgi:4a-hydroxytetrahydrobiopterin dehydratase